jgi:3-dehydroquinate synthetase
MDKKNDRKEQLNMVLLRKIGQAEIQRVPPSAWRSLLSDWRKGARP